MDLTLYLLKLHRALRELGLPDKAQAVGKSITNVES